MEVVVVLDKCIALGKSIRQMILKMGVTEELMVEEDLLICRLVYLIHMVVYGRIFLEVMVVEEVYMEVMPVIVELLLLHNMETIYKDQKTGQMEQIRCHMRIFQLNYEDMVLGELFNQ